LGEFPLPSVERCPEVHGDEPDLLFGDFLVHEHLLHPPVDQVEERRVVLFDLGEQRVVDLQVLPQALDGPIYVGEKPGVEEAVAG
jgi:hypothetical protein